MPPGVYGASDACRLESLGRVRVHEGPLATMIRLGAVRNDLPTELTRGVDVSETLGRKVRGEPLEFLQDVIPVRVGCPDGIGQWNYCMRMNICVGSGVGFLCLGTSRRLNTNALVGWGQFPVGVRFGRRGKGDLCETRDDGGPPSDELIARHGLNSVDLGG